MLHARALLEGCAVRKQTVVPTAEAADEGHLPLEAHELGAGVVLALVVGREAAQRPEELERLVVRRGDGDRAQRCLHPLHQPRCRLVLVVAATGVELGELLGHGEGLAWLGLG